MSLNKSDLKDILKTEGLTDLVINGPRDVQIDRGSGMEQIELPQGMLATTSDVRALALDLARSAKTRLDDASPIVDGELPYGVRLNAVLSPIASPNAGAFISLRTHPSHIYTLEGLEKKGMLSKIQRRKLQKIIREKKSIVISGATGSGKTTLMSAMLKEVPTNERIVAIEESRELAGDMHPGLVLLSSRRPNSENAGEITLGELLKSTLRMRPDRIVLGELRGKEVREYLLALGAGYSGSMTTLHAKSASDVKNRLITLASMSGVYSKLAKIQYEAYVDAVVHVTKTTRGRRVMEILDVQTRKYISALEDSSGGN